MLVARINPPVKRIIQTGAFETKEFTGELMVAKCSKLVIGTSDKIEFEVRFGNVKYEKNLDGSQGKALFDKVYQLRIDFDQSEMASWGTDDSVVYDIIAQRIGVSILSKEDMDMPFNT